MTMSTAFLKKTLPGLWRLFLMMSGIFTCFLKRSGSGYSSGGTRPYFKNDHRIIIDPGKNLKKMK